ncbi:MAG: hypothetical protein A2481_03040 [Candidatus Yonathbacteria bacterium RIFOXYC2_FULL_47_9]|nr:MAG: hypothetical protein A2481_03040 [Candidatus Yonathbacteria bacterium RIFOXYC2_FULL_47_9]HAT67991.1 hypothetical protein [Candidatus Yonathbacteria bacterium]
MWGIMKNFKRIAKWVGLVLVVSFVALFVSRMFHVYNLEKTEEQVAKIHATRLTMDDVMGKSLPPDPGAEADKTIAGIDANKNGIRDDVELAIFKEYPDSAKTRAVLLQYALALQMEVIQPVVNKETVTEVATEGSRADTCLADTLVPRKSPESSRNDTEIEKINMYTAFVKNKQLNTEARKKSQHDFYQGKLGSYSESTNVVCDTDHLLFLN